MEIDRIFGEFCAVNAKDGKGLVTVTLNRPMLDTEEVVLAAELTEGTDLEDEAFIVVDATKDKAVVQYTFTTIANATAEDISVVVSAKVGAADAVKATAFVVDADAQAVVDAAKDKLTKADLEAKLGEVDAGSDEEAAVKAAVKAAAEEIVGEGFVVTGTDGATVTTTEETKTVKVTLKVEKDGKHASTTELTLTYVLK